MADGPYIVHGTGLSMAAKLSLNNIHWVNWHWHASRYEALLEIQMQICGVTQPTSKKDKIQWLPHASFTWNW